MKLSAKNYKFFAVYFMMFFTEALSYCLLIAFLTSLGYSATERSIFFVCDAIFGMIVQVIFGYLCDRYLTIKRYYYIGMIIYGAVAFLLYRTTQMNFWLHTILVMNLGALMRTTNGLIDSLTLETSEECRNNYGIIRAFGSVGWAVGAPFAAKVVELFGYKNLGVAYVVSALILIAITFKVDDVRKKTAKNSVTFADIRNLISDKGYFIVVTMLLLFFIVDSMQNYSIPDKILFLGGSETDVGNYWALAAMIELPLFLYGGKLVERFGAMKVTAFAGLFYIIKYVLYGLASVVGHMFLVGLFQSVTYPLLIVSSKILVNEHTPEHVKTSGLQLALSVYGGGSALISPLLNGLLEDSIGISNTMMVIAVLAIIPTLFSVYMISKNKNKPV